MSLQDIARVTKQMELLPILDDYIPISGDFGVAILDKSGEIKYNKISSDVISEVRRLYPGKGFWSGEITLNGKGYLASVYQLPNSFTFVVVQKQIAREVYA